MARFSSGALLLLLCFVALVAAWTKEDHEIFRVRDELVALEGENSTFYSFLGIKPSASRDDINKAYRKKSRTIHPDKARSNFLSEYAKQHEPVGSGKKQSTKRKQPSQKELAAFNKEASARFSCSVFVPASSVVLSASVTITSCAMAFPPGAEPVTTTSASDPA
ncbi:hypothetical protein AAFC00_003730 [Neodothiora populina]|uniref:J domain-containing protein n=1 Tax=Neodothiora populina TaxID=2781224 RepID=A0ABR3PF75_9PEZI